MSIIIMLCKNTIKSFKENIEKRRQFVTVFMGLIVLIFYNLTFDYGFSFLVLLLIAFVFIALLENNTSGDNLNIKYLDLPIFIALTLVSVILICSSVGKYGVKDNSIKTILNPYDINYRLKYIQEEASENTDEIKLFIQNEPYVLQDSMYKRYWHTVFLNEKNLNDEELFKIIDFGLNLFKTIKPATPMYIETINSRARVMTDTLRKLPNIEREGIDSRVQELRDLIIEEYKTNVKNIKDINRNQKTVEECDIILEEYNQILMRVNIDVNNI